MILLWRLSARGIRIIAPIPGKGAIGVEIPNAEAAIVNARAVLGKVRDSKLQLPLSLGKTISGDVYLTDLSLNASSSDCRFNRFWKKCWYKYDNQQSCCIPKFLLM